MNEACYVDIKGNKAVFDSLRNNHKVCYDVEGFSYMANHDLQGKSNLLTMIRKYQEGRLVVDVEGCVPTVMDDLQALKSGGQVWLLSNIEDIVYPNDPKAVIKADGDLKELFQSIKLPNDMLDIEKDLQKNGMKPATDIAKRGPWPRSMVYHPNPRNRSSSSRRSPKGPSSPMLIRQSSFRT